MLTLPSTWDEALHRPVKATWLIQLYYDSTNYVGLSFEDIDYLGTPYYGAVLNKPSIRDAMNLAQSKASTSNISLSVANFKYNGADFSEELFGGTNKYINKDCKIYLYLEDAPADTWDTLTTNWDDEDRDWDAIGVVLQIYQGRIEKMSHTADKIKIDIRALSPWDHVSVPSTYSSNNILAPLAYGDFSGNTSLYTSGTPNNWRACPFDEQDSNESYFLSGTLSESALYPSRYLKTYDAFVPYKGVTNQSTATSGSVERVKIQSNGEYEYLISPTSNSNTTTGSNITVSGSNTMANLRDGDEATFGEVDYSKTYSSGAGGTTADVLEENYVIPQTSDSGYIYMKYDVSAYSSTVDSSSIDVNIISTGNTNGSAAHTSTTGSTQTVIHTISTAISDFDVKLTFNTTHEPNGSATFTAEVKLYEAYFVATKDDEDVDEVYIGADGEKKNYGGDTTNRVDLVHEAHRSLYQNALNMSDSDIDEDSFNALNTARSGWKIRYNQIDSNDIKAVLDKLAYEGSFIYWIKPSDGKLKYYYLPNKSGTSADHTLTKHDVSDLNVNHADFSNIVTKWELMSDKHPAKNEYRTKATLTNSSARTDLNIIDATHGVKEVKLDALVANVSSSADPSSDNTNDNWAGYYDGILGDVGIIVSGKAFGKFAVSMEIGDVVEFSDAPTSKFFGSSYSGKIFVITKTQKTTDAASFTAVEIRK